MFLSFSSYIGCIGRSPRICRVIEHIPVSLVPLHPIHLSYIYSAPYHGGSYFLLHPDIARGQLLFSIVSRQAPEPPSLSLLWFAEHLLRNLAPERNACRRLVFQVVEALPLPTNCHDATVPPHFDSGSQATKTIASHRRRKWLHTYAG
ncbi:hypothetical protein V8C26DRAFT_302141 [Trichoderma gracile]